MQSVSVEGKAEQATSALRFEGRTANKSLEPPDGWANQMSQLWDGTVGLADVDRRCAEHHDSGSSTIRVAEA